MEHSCPACPWQVQTPPSLSRWQGWGGPLRLPSSFSCRNRLIKRFSKAFPCCLPTNTLPAGLCFVLAVPKQAAEVWGAQSQLPPTPGLAGCPEPGCVPACCCVSISTVVSPMPRAVSEDRAGSSADVIAPRGSACFPPRCLALAWTGGVGPCYPSPSLPEQLCRHQARIPRDSLLLVAPPMWRVPEGAGRQAAGLDPFRGFCWCDGHGKGAISGHCLGSSLHWVQEAFPEAGGVTQPPLSGRVNRAGTGPIPASRPSVATLAQMLVGWWVNCISPQPCAGGQADGKALERLCYPRGDSPAPLLCGVPIPMLLQGPCCCPAGAEGPGAKGQREDRP